MKKVFGLLFLAGLIAIAAPVRAAEQLGVYVAPKLVYGLVQMNGVKGHGAMGGMAETFRIGNKTDHTFGGALAFGYDFEKQHGVPVRAELEYAGFTEADAKKTYRDGADSHTLKQSFSIQTLFLNAYWDIDTGTKLTPYIGAGVGLGFVSTRLKYKGEDAVSFWGASTGSRTVTNFAWNVGAGIGYDITENWSLDAGYRFVGLGSAKTKTFNEYGLEARGKAGDVYQHQFALGIRYTF